MEFLGNYANKTRGEDTNFATAMALNALLDIWTISKVYKTLIYFSISY